MKFNMKYKNKQIIIDLGCGTGNELKKYYKKYNIIGIDIDPENIQICKKNMPEGTWIIDDVSKFKFENIKNIKKIICTEVIEHVDDWKSVIKNLNKIQNNTELYLTVPHKTSEKKLLKIKKNYWTEIGHKHFFTGKELQQKLKNNGWKNIKIKKTNASLYFELKSLFKKNAPCIRGTYYENILPLPIKIFWQLFKTNLFQTKLKYLFPIWMITLPISLILNKFWGATIQITAIK
jgi:trans-aconitate methyltransferase